MKIGVVIDSGGENGTLAGMVEAIRRAEEACFGFVSLPNIFGFDALTVLALAGGVTSRIELTTGVVPTYPRHPVALAQQALTVQAACSGRLVLGIGLSHKLVIEDMFGLDYSRPVPHAREYLTVLNGLLGGERLVFKGEEYKVAAQFSVPGASRPQLVIAALGPAMLRLAGRLADGTVTWMGSVEYLRDTAVPAISEAAARAGRPAPRVIAGFPVCVTDDPAAARAIAEQAFVVYGQLPSYRATLDRGGAAGPGDVAIVGDERAVEQQIAAVAATGATDFAASIFGPNPQRTRDLLAGIASGRVGD
jgi:5,10-methylenetetrahydromethanopterin reductase